MTDRFRAELRDSGVPVLELSGPPRKRLAAALDACDALVAEGWSLAAPLPQRDTVADDG